MAFEISDVGVVAAELMEQLEHDYADRDARLGVVAVVAEVNYGPEGESVCSVEFQCSDARRWIQIGLFEAAKRAAIDSSEHPEDD